MKTLRHGKVEKIAKDPTASKIHTLNNDSINFQELNELEVLDPGCSPLSEGYSR